MSNTTKSIIFTIFGLFFALSDFLFSQNFYNSPPNQPKLTLPNLTNSFTTIDDKKIDPEQLKNKGSK